MRALRRGWAVVLAALVLVPAAGTAPSRHPVAIFFYPWYGNPAYFPARGAYSSSDGRILDRQMAEIAAAGVNEVVTSWWGWGSPTDERLPEVLRAAARHQLRVAIHIEPFDGRNAEAVAADVIHLHELGIDDFYVFRAEDISALDWALMRPSLPRVRLFAQTGRVGFAAAAGFDGVYTYDIVTYGAEKLGRLCREARRVHLLCAPSVGPGYDAERADGDLQLKLRRSGATYDAMWAAALAGRADVVTITSYNEWGEGTQIEPARTAPGYRNYQGAWGRRGPAAARAYLDRTAYWTARFRAQH
jgi:hypothetical protein